MLYAEIQTSRVKAWEVVKARNHKILKVYTSTEDASDLLIIGWAKMDLTNGKHLEGNFLARAIFSNIESLEDIRMNYFQVWGVSLLTSQLPSIIPY